MIKRVSVYIDGANFVYGLKSLHYNAYLKQDINPRRFKEQQKLFARLRKISKCHVILCKRQKRFTDEDEEYYTIKGDDIYLALDMLNHAWENKYDKAILFSGDGDFTQLVKYVKEKKREIEIVSFYELVSKSLINEVDKYTLIDKKIANKFFYRTKEQIFQKSNKTNNI